MTATERMVREEWKAEHGEEMPEDVISDSDRAYWKQQESYF